jgi:hypothetical protein
VLLAAAEVGAPLPVDEHDEQQRHVGEAEQLEENAPLPRAPLFLEPRARQLRDQIALPLPAIFSHRKIP